MPKDTASFADAINEARQIPEDTGEGASRELPAGLLGFPVPTGEPIIDGDKLKSNAKETKEDNGIYGVPSYRLRAHVRRFVLGAIPADKFGDDDLGELDDSLAYEQLMNDMLRGSAVPRWEERNILRNGTLVIICSWLTILPKKETNQKETTD